MEFERINSSLSEKCENLNSDIKSEKSESFSDASEEREKLTEVDTPNETALLRNPNISEVGENKYSNIEIPERPTYGEVDEPYAGGLIIDELPDYYTDDIIKEKLESEKSTENNDDVGKNCPIENGTWDGERGNSTWHPEGDYIPQKKNPDNQTWREILNEFDIDRIDFKDGEPDFSDISKGNVEIDGFSDNRDDNFDEADIELAMQKGCSPEDVEKWRKEHGYTWHECKDMKTMQKVPSKVHNNISHRGGISEKKNGG